MFRTKFRNKKLANSFMESLKDTDDVSTYYIDSDVLDRVCGVYMIRRRTETISIGMFGRQSLHQFFAYKYKTQFEFLGKHCETDNVAEIGPHSRLAPIIGPTHYVMKAHTKDFNFKQFYLYVFGTKDWRL